jgi:hypothetical protein
MTFSKGYTPWNKKQISKETVKCGCGCGQDMEKYDNRGRIRKYIYKHGYNNGKKFPTIKHDKQFKKGDKPWNKGIHVENAGTFKKGHRGMRAEENPNWRGGFVMKNGYKAMVVEGRKIYVHRYVVEQSIGRKLEKNEHVHHLNHDKLDNRIENLKILSPQEHSRYHATTMWAKYKSERVIDDLS